MTRIRRLALPAAACAALALLLWAVYGAGNVGYDTYYALLWGDQLSEGTLPTYEAPRSPTPHPLSNLVGLALVPFGGGADEAMVAITLVSFGALAVAAFALGRALVSWPVGVVFAAVLLTRPLLVEQALSTSIDIPFLALVVAAAAVEVRRSGSWPAVLALLGVAGLLRPEAWGVSAAYLVYAWRMVPPGDRARMAGLAAAAPVIWVASDLVVTGDPRWSFDQARATAERTGAPGGITETIAWAGRAMKGVLHPAFAAGGALGVVLAVRFFGRRALVPLALLSLGAASFLMIGFAGLPLLTRYFFLGGTMLALFFAVAVAGWTGLPPGDRDRRLWMAGAAVLAGVVVATLPYEYESVDGRLREANRRGDAQTDLERLVGQPAARAAIGSCSPLYSRVFRARPQLLFLRRDDPDVEIVARRSLAPTRGLLLRYVDEREPAAAPGFRNLAASRSWSLLTACRSTTMPRR